MRINRPLLSLLLAASVAQSAFAADDIFVAPATRVTPVVEKTNLAAHDDGYIEPGTLRLSHNLTLEGLMHRETQGYREVKNGIKKDYVKDGDGNGPTRFEWGESLLTEAAARFTPGIFARVLFEAQGDYADRFWRPINEEHRIDDHNRNAFVREAEARVEQDQWWARGFEGVGHDSWESQGDFFRLYPAAFPDDDYLRHSGYFGIYPDRFRQNLFMNISGRRAPKGIEAGAQLYGFDGAVATGSELGWGLGPSTYARLATNFGSSRVTLVGKDEQQPTSLATPGIDNHFRSGALSWDLSTTEGQRWRAGVLYSPYRADEHYLVAHPVSHGTGIQGSAWNISSRKAKDQDGLGFRGRVDRHSDVFDREFLWSADLQHLGILAGNKDQVDLRLGTDLIPRFRGNIHYMYRRPIEGPMPFLYEGTPDDIGNIVSQPRGPESPFTVNWSNRETVSLTTTIWFDPTPGTNLLVYDQDVLESWNINPGENAPLAVAFQHRMTDLRTPTDRQSYYNSSGDILFDSPAHSGAWATNGFIHEYRLVFIGREKPSKWTLGIAGGQTPATGNSAYSTDASVNKPLTEYYSVEARLDRGPWNIWGHYGSGIWGPEPYQVFFGESFDRLWGGGVGYSITSNTTIDVTYLAARQDNNQFVAPDLGSYDEFRFLFSHRFGFLFQFTEPERAGYKAR